MSRTTSLKKEESVPLRTWGEDEEEGDVFMHSDDDFQNLAHKLKKDSKKYDPLKGNVVPIVNSDSSDGAATSLIRAVQRGSSTTATFLQETKPEEINIGETDCHHRNALHHAVIKPDSLTTLLKHFKTDPSLEAALRQEDEFGEMPIHRAASMGNSKSLEILYEFDNTLLGLQSKVTKRSVLHFAVKGAALLAVEFVLRKDLEQMKIDDSMLRSPIHYAARLKQADILAILTSKGADIMQKDANGQLPIHIAAKEGLLNNVQLLIDVSPVCIDCRDNKEQTPLILAAKNGFPHVVSHLLSKKANYAAKDTYDCTAFDWAVKRKAAGVVEVFLGKDYWKEIINGSKLDPGSCLKTLVENMPETSVKLMDKCITVHGTKRDPKNYQVRYDFFCLESTGSPPFEALNSMVENRREKCLSHPLCVKYVDVKWRKRAFKCNLASIILALVFHISLIIFTTNVRGVVTLTNVTVKELGGKNVRREIPVRHGMRPDNKWLMLLRVIMVAIALGTMVKELFQMIMQRLRYFFQADHYVQWVLCVSVLLLLLPVEQKISRRQLGSGSVTVFLSWTMLLDFLRFMPGVGIYIWAIYKVLLTLMKIFVVVFIYLLSFASTFYILLAEYESYRTFPISIVSTFMAMTSGPDYYGLFLLEGAYPRLYYIKLVFLVLFVLVMSIVVNNTLIGLAVGDTNEVMKSAKLEKFLHKARYIIHVENSINGLPGFCMKKDEYAVEFPERKKEPYEMFFDLLFEGEKLDAVDGITDEEDGMRSEGEFQTTMEEHIEKLLEAKMDKLQSTLQLELQEMFVKMNDKLKEDFEKKKQI